LSPNSFETLHRSNTLPRTALTWWLDWQGDAPEEGDRRHHCDSIPRVGHASVATARGVPPAMTFMTAVAHPSWGPTAIAAVR
jgi:hypothetical protein